MSAMARILGPVTGIALIKTDPRYPYWSAAATMLLCLILIATLRHKQFAPAADDSATAQPPTV